MVLSRLWVWVHRTRCDKGFFVIFVALWDKTGFLQEIAVEDRTVVSSGIVWKKASLVNGRGGGGGGGGGGGRVVVVVVCGSCGGVAVAVVITVNVCSRK